MERAKQVHPVEPVFELRSLDGTPRKARMDFNVLAEFEEETGRKVVTEGGMKDVSAREARALIFLMLKQEDEDITIEEVGRMLHVGNFSAIGEEIQSIFSQAMPEEGEGGDDSGNPQNPSTG